MNVTLDVFSALIDSRTGGSQVFDQIARRKRWALRGQALYRGWDREHKGLQRECVCGGSLSPRWVAGPWSRCWMSTGSAAPS